MDDSQDGQQPKRKRNRSRKTAGTRNRATPQTDVGPGGGDGNTASQAGQTQAGQGQQLPTAAGPVKRRVRNRSGIKNRPASGQIGQTVAASSSLPISFQPPLSFVGETWNMNEKWSAYAARQIQRFNLVLESYKNHFALAFMPSPRGQALAN